MSTVLHLIDLAGPGGAETIFVQLATHLRERGWNSIAAVPAHGWAFEELRSAGIDPIIAPINGRSFDLNHLSDLVRIIRRHRVRLIQSHLLGPGVYASMAAALQGIPGVCTFHGQVDVSANERFRKLKFHLIRRSSPKTVFVSESLRRFFLANTTLPLEATEVIPNGIPLPTKVSGRRSRFRDEIGVTPDQFLVGAIGHLRPAKSYHVFLRAAASLFRSRPDYRFVIVGRPEGNVEDSLRRLCDELGLSEVVMFLGYRTDIDVILGGLDCYAITSSSEGFSLSTVQAMASSVPIVATRCGGPEDILVDGMTGFLVPVGSELGVAAAIDRIRACPDRTRKMIEAARKEASERYSLDSMVNSYDRLYREVLSLHGR